MTVLQIAIASTIWLVLTAIVYRHTGWKKVCDCYKMWFTRKYWTDYNIVEGISWLAKAIIIVPGLIFGIQIIRHHQIWVMAILS